nr:unnamed protein product [Spirometra erinaceieuropaei]
MASPQSTPQDEAEDAQVGHLDDFAVWGGDLDNLRESVTSTSAFTRSSSLTVLSQACDGDDEDSVQSSLHAVSHPDQGSPSRRSRRRYRHQPQPQSQTPSSNSSNYRPPPASLASSSTKSHQPASLPVRTPRHTDSLVTMPFSPTFDVKRCLVQEEEEVNMHNLPPEVAIPDEEMSTEVDIALLTSLESEVASTVSCSADWVSEHSVTATPTEMRVHAPLPVWPSDKLMESSEVGRLPLVRKRRAKFSVQAAGDLCVATTQENCLVYAAHRAWARRLVKRKSNLEDILLPIVSRTRQRGCALVSIQRGTVPPIRHR